MAGLSAMLYWALSSFLFVWLYLYDSGLFVGDHVTAIDVILIPSSAVYAVSAVVNSVRLVSTALRGRKTFEKTPVVFVAARIKHHKRRSVKGERWKGRGRKKNATGARQPATRTELVEDGGACAERLDGVPASTVQVGPTVQTESSPPPVKPSPARSESGSAPPEGAPTSPRPPARKKNPPPPPPKKKKVESSNGSTLKPFYWVKVPRESATIWCELPKAASISPQLGAMLGGLFSTDRGRKAATQMVKTVKAAEQDSNEATPRIISAARATNIGILFRQFKRMGVEGICAAALTGIGIGTDAIPLIQQICPTVAEEKTLEPYIGSHSALCNAEKILVEMCQVARLQRKCACGRIIDEWDHSLRKAKQMLSTVKQACDQVRASGHLKSIIANILNVGNALNEGSRLGSAVAFKLESLSRLADTRPCNPGEDQSCGGVQPFVESLLDFVILVIHSARRDFTGKANQFLESQLAELPIACDFLNGNLTKVLSGIHDGFETLECELCAMTGMAWSKLSQLTIDEFAPIQLKIGVPYADEERQFAAFLFNFFKSVEATRTDIFENWEHLQQELTSMAEWLGAPTINPKTILKDILAFARDFDAAYDRLSAHLEWQ